MKKLTLLLFFLQCLLSAAQAQDRIVRTDATTIEARVTEVTPDEIRYKRLSNPEGPTYVLPVSNVCYILYPNGERDVFNGELTVEIQAENPAPKKPLAEAASHPEEASVGERNASADTFAKIQKGQGQEVFAPARTYAIGDYYEKGSVRGVVCDLFDEGQHGLILSLDEIYLPWSTVPKVTLKGMRADSNADGEANMQAVELYIAANNLSWDNFPAFKWCREQGEGWYLPATDEILRVSANYNGGVRTIYNREARNRFNNVLRANGGKRMDRLAYYLSSTERDVKSAICTHVDLEPPFVADVSKNTRFLVRAVRRF